jgi:hypothetical protein
MRPNLSHCLTCSLMKSISLAGSGNCLVNTGSVERRRIVCVMSEARPTSNLSAEKTEAYL